MKTLMGWSCAYGLTEFYGRTGCYDMREISVQSWYSADNQKIAGAYEVGVKFFTNLVVSPVEWCSRDSKKFPETMRTHFYPPSFAIF